VAFVIFGLFQRVAVGIALMTLSFFLTLGLYTTRFDHVRYSFSVSGLSVIIITLMAAFMLKEKLTLQLTIGTC